MQRRNFILGLGTVATLSGAASVTGASLAEATTADADFRVIVDERFIVAEGDNTGSYQNGAEESLTFEDLTTDDVPVAYSQGATDDGEGLTVETASQDDSTHDFGDADLDTGTGIFEIRNEGDTTESVGIQHLTYGSGVDDEDASAPDEADVDDTFSYVADKGTGETVIGPDPGGEDTFLELEPDETAQVRVEADTNNVAIESSGNPFEQDSDNVDLLDEIEIGTQN